LVVKVGISFLYFRVSKQLARDFKVRLKRWNFIKFQIKFGLNFKLKSLAEFYRPFALNPAFCANLIKFQSSAERLEI